MGFAEIIAFVKAFPLLVEKIDQLVGAIKDLRQDSINKELEKINAEVDKRIQQLIMADTDEKRKLALLDLARATRK